MDRQVGLLFLPPEVLCHIASYLSVEDILSCSATCSWMRQALNDDLVWKRHCSFQSADYLKWGESVVKPGFECYGHENCDLEMCTWRKHYMMEACLSKNWKSGKYTVEQFEFGPPGEVFVKTNVKFFENDYFYFHSEQIAKNRVVDEIWNVANSPVLHTVLNLNISNFSEYEFDVLGSFDTHKVSKDKLVVTFSGVVLVYTISLSSFSQISVDHAFMFWKSENDSNVIEEFNFKSETLVSGIFFVGSNLLNQESDIVLLHIWNIQTGKKLKEEVVPLKNVSVVSFKLLGASDSENDLIVMLQVRRHRHTLHYFGYNLSKLEFSSFSVKHGYCKFKIFKGGYVFGIGPRRLFLYSYKTSKKLAMWSSNQEVLDKTVTVVSNTLLFGTFESVIHVLGIPKFDLLHTVKLGFILYSLHALPNNFVVVNSTRCEVWDFKNQPKKLFKFPNDGSLAAVNNHGTKLVIERRNSFVILNFW